MTVKELVEWLQTLPDQDAAQVWLIDDGSWRECEHMNFDIETCSVLLSNEPL